MFCFFLHQKSHVATWPAVNLFCAGPGRWHGRKAASVTYLKNTATTAIRVRAEYLALWITCPQATHIVHDLRDGAHHPAVASDGVTICQRVSRSKHCI